MRYLLLILLMLAGNARGFDLEKPSCYPVFGAGIADVIEAKLDMRDGPDVGVWWCKTDTGLQQNARGGEWGSICERCFRDAIKSLSDLWTLDKSRVTRPLTAVEASMVANLERLYEPRCVFATTAKTTGVRPLSADGKVAAASAIRISTSVARPSCYEWVVEGSKRYCSVTGLQDTKGELIRARQYVQCLITTAPVGGWSAL